MCYSDAATSKLSVGPQIKERLQNKNQMFGLILQKVDNFERNKFSTYPLFALKES